MIAVERCLICDASIAREKSGIVAPFLAETIWNRKAFTVKLSQCSRCGFLFFNPRLEPEEEKQLYHQYRSESYQKRRFRHEPWYTETLNRDLGSETSVLAFRQDLLASVVAKNAGSQSLKNVLDFGGDHGQLLRKVPATNKYVYDISGVEKEAGVVGLQTFDDCLAHDFDLIVCSHVLEHVAFPKNLLAQMKQVSRPGTLLYLEVPLESPFSSASIMKRIIQTLMLCVTRVNDGLNLLRPSGIYLMHEHVNFFMAKTLAGLAEVFGFKVVAAGQYAGQGLPLTKTASIWCLARL